MAAQDYRLAAPRERNDQIFHLATANGIKAGGRFVENDEVGVIDERLCQSDAPLHAFGKFANGARLGFAEANHVEQLLCALAALDWA